MPADRTRHPRGCCNYSSSSIVGAMACPCPARLVFALLVLAPLKLNVRENQILRIARERL